MRDLSAAAEGPTPLAVFLFPWVLTIRALGVGGLKAMLGFVAILGLAWVYAYREGILEWK